MGQQSCDSKQVALHIEQTFQQWAQQPQPEPWVCMAGQAMRLGTPARLCMWAACVQSARMHAWAWIKRSLFLEDFPQTWVTTADSQRLQLSTALERLAAA